MTKIRIKYCSKTCLKGEATDVMPADNLSSNEWLLGSLIAKKQQPLTWHEATFNAPVGDKLFIQMMRSTKSQPISLLH
nr:beta-galactosidase 3-like [Tanacetum cinerariifolium]